MFTVYFLGEIVELLDACLLYTSDYGLYFKLLSKNELNDYLLKVQKEADDLYERLAEELKQKNQIKWVLMMNNINSCVYEIINKEIIKI